MEITFPPLAEAALFWSSVSFFLFSFFLFFFLFVFFLNFFSFLDLTISHAERIQRFLGHKPKGNHGEKGWFAQPPALPCQYQKLTWKSNTSFLKEAVAGGI